MTDNWRTALLGRRLLWVQVAKAEPTRGLAAVQHEHGLELAACDLSTGELNLLGVPTDGFIDTAWIAPDGRAAFTLVDAGGDETGHVHRISLDGAGQAEDMTPGFPGYQLRGADISVDGRTLVLNAVTDEGYHLLALPAQGAPVARPRVVTRLVNEAWNCHVSADGTVATLDTTDHAPGTRRFAVTAYDVATGEVVGTLELPAPGAASVVRFSPVPGDQRVLVDAERAGDRSGVLIWDPVAGTSVQLAEDGQATLRPLDWSSDGRYLLLCVEKLARQWLERLDVDSGHRERLDLPAGSFYDRYVHTSQFGRGATVLASHSNATTPVRVIAWHGPGSSEVVLGGTGAPDRRGYEHVLFPSSDGTQIQAWLGRPAGDGPFPTVISCHGGPHVAVVDKFNPEMSAWLDNGFAYLTVNYRGSSGRGRAFEEQIHGDIGHWELEDLAAAHEWLVKEGIAAKDRILIAGASYGGFLVLYALGRQPELWAAGIGTVVLADWALTHRDSPLAMRRLDELLFGGTPDTRADLYRDRSPLTYVDQVRAPILITQGRNDTRTPPAQLIAYTDRLDARGHPYEMYWYDGGHGIGDAQAEIDEISRAITFARAVIGS